MSQDKQVAVEMLEEIDRSRSGSQNLEELEEKLWRLLDRASVSFPPQLSGKMEDLVLELKNLQALNLSFGAGHEVDRDKGSEDLYNDAIGALYRFLAK